MHGVLSLAHSTVDTRGVPTPTGGFGCHPGGDVDARWCGPMWCVSETPPGCV